MKRTRKEVVAKFYDSFAKDYDQSRYSSDKQKKIDEHTKAVVLDLVGDVRHKTVLDCGCGTGRFADLFVQRGATVVGMDISENMIKIAKKKVPSAEFTIGDVFNTPFKERQFDIVVCSQVLTHLHEYESPLFEMKRVTKDDGTIIVDMRNILSPLNFLYNLRQKVIHRSAEYYPHYTHIWNLKQICNKIGLNVIEFRGISPFSKTISVNSKLGKYFAPTLVLKISKKTN